MKILLTRSFLFMLLIHFMLCLNDPRGNGGLDTPNIEVGDPFDHLGEQETLKKEISKSPKKINDGELVEDDNEFTNEGTIGCTSKPIASNYLWKRLLDEWLLFGFIALIICAIMLVLALFMVWKRAQFDLTQKENELNHFKNENTVLKKEIAQIKRNNNRFQQQAREEILKLTTEIKEVEKEINNLRQTNNNIQRQARFDLKQKRDQLAKLKTESKQNNDRLREQARMEHNQIELELFKLKLENDRLRKEECDLKQRNHRTQEHSRFHLNKTQNELFKVQFEYTEVKKEADELKQALLKQEKEELLPLKIENEKLKKEIHELKEIHSRRRNHRENSREPVEHECTAWMNTH